MPIYEYHCDACGNDFDYYARRLLDAPEACPKCGGTTLKKAFSSFCATTSSSETCGGCEGGCPHAHGAGCGCGCC